MCNKGFLKRMLPFLATFAVSVFIVSFFFGFGGSRFRGRGYPALTLNNIIAGLCRKPLPPGARKELPSD